MAIVADSGGIYGLYDRRDTWHVRLRRVIEAERDEIVIPITALAEIDYLLRARLGNSAVLQFLEDLKTGAFRVEPVTMEDLNRCAALLAKYADLDLGLADASVVVAAERLRTDRILTVDRRDFRALRSWRGKPFRLLPAEEPS
jgi:hypothetical protein